MGVIQFFIILGLVYAVLAHDVQESDADPAAMVTLTEEDFGTYEGTPVKKFTWRTPSGFSVSAISYGTHIQSIMVPDKDGILKDVVLGFDDLDGYVNRNTPYLGATIGRCANRIGNASFNIDGQTYQLAKNQGKDSLHGGIVGFDKKMWDTTVVGKKVIFSYYSKDMEENFPGDLVVNIIFSVLDDDSIHLEYIGVSTKKTVINLTNHAYFNLAGHDGGAQELFKHVVEINADQITETDADSIPTGKLLDVKGTAYDFLKPKKLSDDMPATSFDDNFCINSQKNELALASITTHPPSGRYLEIHTNQPGVQFYTANSLPSPDEPALIGKDSVGYRRHGAFCFETQKYPDAVHHDNFLTTVLVPGQVYNHKAVYKFGVRK